MDFSFPKTTSSGSGTSNVVIDDTKFTIGSGCGTITTYTFTETTVSNSGLTQTGCSAADTSASCRTIIVPTSAARIIGGTLPEFKY